MAYSTNSRVYVIVSVAAKQRVGICLQRVPRFQFPSALN
jgi:hypothetical protein